jgi:hypothetical protein
VPLTGAVGIAVSPEVRLALGLHVPITAFFAPSAQFVIGTLFGFGLDYFLDPRLLVGLNAHVGPIFSTDWNGSRLGLVTQIAIGYRM